MSFKVALSMILGYVLITATALTTLISCAREPRNRPTTRPEPINQSTERGDSGLIKQSTDVPDLMYARDPKRGVICYRFVGREGMFCIKESNQ